MSHAKARLEQARTQLAAINTEHDAILEEQRAIESNAREVAQVVQQPVADRVGFFKSLFRQGKKPTQDEVKRARAEIAEQAAATAQIAEIEKAKSEALAELEGKRLALAHQRRAASLEAAAAQFDLAGEQMSAEIIPEFMRAVEQFKAAYAKLAGAGKAHHEMARALRQEGVSVQAIGTDYPNIHIDIVTLGFPIGVGPGSNLIRLDASALIEAAKVEALQRWR